MSHDQMKCEPSWSGKVSLRSSTPSITPANDYSHVLPILSLQRLTDDFDRYIVLSFTNATMVLEVWMCAITTMYLASMIAVM